jgi:hypothetical protein
LIGIAETFKVERLAKHALILVGGNTVIVDDFPGLAGMVVTGRALDNTCAALAHFLTSGGAISTRETIIIKVGRKNALVVLNCPQLAILVLARSHFRFASSVRLANSSVVIAGSTGDCSVYTTTIRRASPCAAVTVHARLPTLALVSANAFVAAIATILARGDSVHAL